MDLSKLKEKIRVDVIKTLDLKFGSFKELRCNIDDINNVIDTYIDVMKNKFSDIKYNIEGFYFDFNTRIITVDMEINENG